jgi:hypothetical protein
VNVGVLQELQELELAPAEIALVQYPAVRTWAACGQFYETVSAVI